MPVPLYLQTGQELFQLVQVMGLAAMDCIKIYGVHLLLLM